MPGLEEKPSFHSMCDAVSERILTDPVVALVHQCAANPSIMEKFFENAGILEAIYRRWKYQQQLQLQEPMK